MRILIADDDQEIVRLLSMALAARGFSVSVAMDTMQALMFARQNQPALILMDVNMPGGNGLSALAKIKSGANTNDIPVVMISASSSDAVEKQALSSGAFAFLPKPLDLDLLFATISRAIATSSSSDQSLAPASDERVRETPAARDSVIRVLIAEDDPVHRKMLEGFFRNWGFDLVVARDGEEAARVLSEPNPPRLAVLDWMMPGIDGPELCQRVRQKTGPYTFIILLTSKGQKAEVVQGIESGADDYLVKPFHPQELLARLRTGIRILRLEELLLASQQELEVLAMRDALTGLLNRRAVLDTLAREVSRGEKNSEPVSVVLVDVDHFKKINDTQGHAIGDSALRSVAAALQSGIRKADAVGRYGGEEFLVVAPRCDAESAARLAERLRQAVENAVVSDSAAPIRLSISCGTVTVGPHDLCEPEALIAAADAALYRAKAAGRNRVVAADAFLSPLAVAV